MGKLPRNPPSSMRVNNNPKDLPAPTNSVNLQTVRYNNDLKRTFIDLVSDNPIYHFVIMRNMK